MNSEDNRNYFRTRLKIFGYIWLTLAVLLILAGIAGTWMKGGFAAVEELLSPFNVVNWIVTVITLAPGLGALAWAQNLKAKTSVAHASGDLPS